MAKIRHRSVKPDVICDLHIQGEHITTVQEVYIEAREGLEVTLMHANGERRTLVTTSSDSGVYRDLKAPESVTFRLLSQDQEAAA